MKTYSLGFDNFDFDGNWDHIHQPVPVGNFVLVQLNLVDLDVHSNQRLK